MAYKTVKQFYLSEHDKDMISSFGVKIVTMLKLKGFDIFYDFLWDFFEYKDFDFIPCIAEALEGKADDDFFYDDVLDEIKKVAKSFWDVVNVSSSDFLEYVNKKGLDAFSLLCQKIDEQNLKIETLLDYFWDNIDLDQKHKFIEWVIN